MKKQNSNVGTKNEDVANATSLAKNTNVNNVKVANVEHSADPGNIAVV